MQFTTLNGSGNPGYGLGMVDATSGASLPMSVNSDDPQRRRELGDHRA